MSSAGTGQKSHAKGAVDRSHAERRRGTQAPTQTRGDAQPAHRNRPGLRRRRQQQGKHGDSMQAYASSGKNDVQSYPATSYVHFDKTFNMFYELLTSLPGQPLDHGLRTVPGGFTFLDLGAAPGGFSSCLLEHPSCAWGMGVTLPPDVGFPMLLGCGMGACGNYYTHYADLLQVQACDLAFSLGGERVDLCLCDAQNMRERHGVAQKNQQGFVGFYGGSYGSNISPKLESLVIWALLFHQLGLAFSLLEEYGSVIFRFSWVLSVYDAEVEDCDRGYYDATMQLFHLLAEVFGIVDVFKSSVYHVSDSTCYIICHDLRRSRLEALLAPCGGIQNVFQQGTQEALRFESMDKLPDALCLNVLPRPCSTRVKAIALLLEKVTALREVGRMRKGISNGSRFAHVDEAACVVIGRPLCQDDDCVREPADILAEQSPQDQGHHIENSDAKMRERRVTQDQESFAPSDRGQEFVVPECPAQHSESSKAHRLTWNEGHTPSVSEHLTQHSFQAVEVESVVAEDCFPYLDSARQEVSHTKELEKELRSHSQVEHEIGPLKASLRTASGASSPDQESSVFLGSHAEAKEQHSQATFSPGRCGTPSRSESTLLISTKVSTLLLLLVLALLCYSFMR